MSMTDKALKAYNYIPKVYQAGKNAERDILFDTYQDYGNRDVYSEGAFGEYWTDEIFNPKYDIYIGTRTFSNSDIENLAEKLDENGVRLKYKYDIGENLDNTFASSRIKTIPDLRDAGVVQFLNGTFAQSLVEHIGGIKVDEYTSYQNAFAYASNLKYIAFDGVIGKSITFDSAVLEAEAMKNIIHHLKDFSGTAQADIQKLTMPQECWDRLEADSAPPGRYLSLFIEGADYTSAFWGRSPGDVQVPYTASDIQTPQDNTNKGMTNIGITASEKSWMYETLAAKAAFTGDARSNKFTYEISGVSAGEYRFFLNISGHNDWSSVKITDQLKIEVNGVEITSDAVGAAPYTTVCAYLGEVELIDGTNTISITTRWTYSSVFIDDMMLENSNGILISTWREYVESLGWNT